MMFIMLTHDNLNTFSSFSLLIAPWLKKTLSGSTDLGLIVIKAWNTFSRLFDLFFVA